MSAGFTQLTTALFATAPTSSHSASVGTVKVRDFANAPACSCKTGRLGEWTAKCLLHELEAAEMAPMTPFSTGDVPSQGSSVLAGLESTEKAVQELDGVFRALDGFQGRLDARMLLQQAQQQEDSDGGEEVEIKDLSYDDGWAEIFARTAPGGEVVEAPQDDEDGTFDYPEQFALSPVDSGVGVRPHHSEGPVGYDYITQEMYQWSDGPDSDIMIEDAPSDRDVVDYDSDGNPLSPYEAPEDFEGYLQAGPDDRFTVPAPRSSESEVNYDSDGNPFSPTYDDEENIVDIAPELGSFSNPIPISDSDSDTSSRTSYDSNGDPIFRLRLPVRGTIAQRRFAARGENLRTIELIQRLNLRLEAELRNVYPVAPELLFRAIDWDDGTAVAPPSEVSPTARVPLGEVMQLETTDRTVVATDADSLWATGQFGQFGHGPIPEEGRMMNEAQQFAALDTDWNWVMATAAPPSVEVNPQPQLQPGQWGEDDVAYDGGELLEALGHTSPRHFDDLEDDGTLGGMAEYI